MKKFLEGRDKGKRREEESSTIGKQIQENLEMESSASPSTQGNTNNTNSQTQTGVSNRLNDSQIKESSFSKISGFSSKDKSLQQRKMHYRPKQKPADNGQKNEQTQVQQPQVEQPNSQSIQQPNQQPTLQSQRQPVLQQYTNNRQHPSQQQTNSSQQHQIFQSIQQQQTPHQQHVQSSATKPTQFLPVFVENLPLDTDAEDFKKTILSHLNIDPSKMYI